MTHDYLSTACLHGLHTSCGKAQHDRGEPGRPHCKWCPAPCRCACHGDVSTVNSEGEHQRWQR